jgi:phospholipid/cholesterol/gamma-HCH transport system substrate-binding protein
MARLLRTSSGQVTLILAGFTALLLAVAAVVELVSVHDQGGYRLTATVADVDGLFDHQTVRLGGVEIGQVDDIGPDPQRGVDLRLSLDPRYAPLHQGVQVSIHSAGLFAEQYVRIVDGPASAPPLPDGAAIPLSRTASAVGLDTVVDTLDSATRAQARTLITQAQTGLSGRSAADLNASLEELHQAAEALDPAMAALSQRTDALDAMISDDEQLATKAASDRAAIGPAVAGLDRGLATFDRHREQVGQALEQAATAARTGEAIVGRSVPELRQLVTQLPGTLQSLDSLLGEVNPFLASLEPLAPQIRQLLVELQRSADGADQNGNYIRVLPQVGEGTLSDNLPQDRLPALPELPVPPPAPGTEAPATGPARDGPSSRDSVARLWEELFR